MPPSGFKSFIQPAPVLDALRRPVRSLLRRYEPPTLRAGTGKVWAGQGQPVLVFPELGQGPPGTVMLRRLLGQAGFSCHDWDQGINDGLRGGGLNDWLRRLEERLIDVSESERSSVTLLGWGLGGLYARELAKRANPLVRQVITVGTPFNTLAGRSRRCAAWRELERDGSQPIVSLHQRLRQCPPVPFTSLYSQADELVPWELCIENETPQSENVEVPDARHLALLQHPRTLEVVSHRLAQPEDHWRPFGALTN